MKKLSLFVVLALCLVMFRAEAAPAAMKVGVFDIQTVVDAIDDGKKARSDIEKAVSKKRNTLKKRETEFKKLQGDLEKQRLVLSAKALEQKKAELDAKKMQLQKAAMDAQMEMQKLELELRGKITKKIQAVAEKIGRQGKYTLILEKQEAGIIFLNNTIDVTSKIIAEYNKAYKKK